jgi:redox-sensitive bicupin YhaK (pirin superfamily)
MPLHTDAFVSAGLFSPDNHASHDLSPGRGAWVQVVDGTVSVDGVTLRTGDGAGFTASDTLDFSFASDSEVLLVDVRMDAPRIWE